MVEDEEGFEYPQIDESKCVRCYQCIKHEHSKERYEHNITYYGSWYRQPIWNGY